MPVEDHPVFIAPNDPNEPIWRYMDFTKFVSLLDRRALFFPSMETLAQIDRFEGSVPKLNLDLRDNLIRNLDIKPLQKRVLLANYSNALGRHNQLFRKVTFVNSWHISSHESAAMWAVYSGNAPGIALVSSYNRLKNSLMTSRENVFLGKVVYIDYSKDRIPEGNLLYVSIHKRQSFEHERELRALVSKMDLVTKLGGDGRLEFDHSKYVAVKGIYVECNLEELVQEVVVSPLAPDWYYELVESISKRYSFSALIRRTDLDAEPVF